jgi:hypothetical protein
VIRCFGFDDPVKTDEHLLPPSGRQVKRGRVVTDVRAAAAGSLRFEVPGKSGADTSGSFSLNFADDLTQQFGEGEEFYVQWRQRFSPEFLNTRFRGSGGWKQIIIGEGDRPQRIRYSCTQLEIVVQNTYQRGLPQMYHSCGGKDGKYEPLEVKEPSGTILLQNGVRCLYGKPEIPPCVGYKANQWMTFQVRVKIGTWYNNDSKYRKDSTIQLWMAEEGKRSQLVIDFSPERGTGYDIANNDPAARYGKLWLLPYQTGKDPSQSHPTAYTWYDELVISRNKIPDP